MKKSKKKYTSIKKDLEHRKTCQDLSRQLAVKYSEMGILADILMTRAIRALVRDKRCDYTIHSGSKMFKNHQSFIKRSSSSSRNQ